MTYGTKADLARRLGVSRSAITAAFKKHGFQQSIDKMFDLDYFEFKLSQKQEQARVTGQRNRKANQPKPTQKPPLVRAVINQLAPVFNEALIHALREQAEYSEDDPDQLYNAFDNFWMFYLGFIKALDTHYPPDLADQSIEHPDLLQRAYAIGGNIAPLIDEILGNGADDPDDDD